MNDNFWYELIKEYYGLGLYTDNDLDPFVQIGYITADNKSQIIASKSTKTTA